MEADVEAVAAGVADGAAAVAGFPRQQEPRVRLVSPRVLDRAAAAKRPLPGLEDRRPARKLVHVLLAARRAGKPQPDQLAARRVKPRLLGSARRPALEERMSLPAAVQRRVSSTTS